jgi:hypothetical protein
MEPKTGCNVTLHPNLKGRAAMPNYHAYIIGENGTHFMKADFLTNHPDDASAVEAAKLLGHEIELWDCGRLVARFSPDGEVWSPGLAPSAIDQEVLPALKMAFGALF